MMTAVFALAALVGFTGTAVAAPASWEQVVQDYAWPPADVTPVWETAAQLAVRTSGFAAREVELVTRVVRGSDVATGEWGHEAQGLFDGQQYVNNNVRFTTPRGEAGFFLQAHAPGHSSSSPAQLCSWSECTGAVRQRDGGLVVFTELPAWSMRTAYSFRPNGEVVYVSTRGEQLSDRVLARFAVDGAFSFARSSA
ncbi:hypothetical protein [Saccharothrix xinjiangensis]